MKEYKTKLRKAAATAGGVLLLTIGSGSFITGEPPNMATMIALGALTGIVLMTDPTANP